MKLLHSLFDKLYTIKALSRFRPVIRAVDEFFFSTDKVTIVSPRSPHILDNIDIKRYMSTVILALLPTVLAAVYFYGFRVVVMIAVSYIFGGLVEVLFAVITKKEVEEGFLVTGLIFPLILPPTTPFWIVAVGIIFGVFFGKMVFGGTGKNIFNPALVGRLFITICFPTLMTTQWLQPLSAGWGGWLKYTADTITSATPLISYKNAQVIPSLFSLLIGTSAGSVGETFRLGIILGGLFLISTRVANWRIPLAYILSVIIFSFCGNQFLSTRFAPPLFQILSGGLLFGAFFMATDPVTTPFTPLGKWIFGICCGLLTVLIRAFSGYVEGVMFSIVLMNGFSPLIDQLVIKTKYKLLSR